MKSTQKSEPTQYSALNDDVLYHLCHLMRTDNFQGLIKLSMVDRRTRVVSIPLIFDQIRTLLFWNEAQVKFGSSSRIRQYSHLYGKVLFLFIFTEVYTINFTIGHDL
ncbi:hypothetical protein FS842_010962 [Serendipita sp. 407]|nr:hypothetical protein FS842_010962 [Serendipita sp. 407]